MEKKPAITEEELTPIILNQLESTRKQKEEHRKTRRGSNSKLENLQKKKENDLVSDSGAESCSETANLFISGIQNVLDDTQAGSKADSKDIVTEVDNVLAKLMISLKKGDVEVPGLEGNIIPLITSLQATLRAKNIQKSAKVDFDSSSENKKNSENFPTIQTYPTQGSKIPWQIRSNKQEICKKTDPPTRILSEEIIQENEHKFREKNIYDIGYVSDVCDYNLRDSYCQEPSAACAEEQESEGVVLGKLSLSLKFDQKSFDDKFCTKNANFKNECIEDNLKTKMKLTEDKEHSRQSSVEENKFEEKGKRKNSGGKSSAIKSKIQMRKMIKEANKNEIINGTISDQDIDEDQDTIDEKQDSESTNEEENYKSKNKSAWNEEIQLPKLTPDSFGQIKDWNIRFSNLKNSFDANSDKEEEFLNAKSHQKNEKPFSDLDVERRGRERVKERVDSKRAQSAHSTLRNSNKRLMSQSPSIGRPQSKDDKNKNNALIANYSTKKISSRPEEDNDDEYLQYLNSVDRYRQSNPNPKPFRPVTSRTDATANPVRKTSDTLLTQRNLSLTQTKSKQTTPVRDTEYCARISRSVPKEVSRPKLFAREETQAEILGLVRTNKETGVVEKTNDMDYEDYMSIINKVRKTKEFTRVRTEQARLASMYAQERKRQEEIKKEEERLRLAREKFEDEKKRSLTNVVYYEKNEVEDFLEKGQFDKAEYEQIKKNVLNYKEDDVTIQDQQIKQQKLREEQVFAEQKKLEQLREEQLRQDMEREEIKRLEIARLKQIQEDQQRLEKEKWKHQEQIRLEQLKLEEERKKQTQLQLERQMQYQKQEEEMITRAIEAKKIEMELLKVEHERQSSMSPNEKLIRDRLKQQEKMREEQLVEEAHIKQEKFNLMRQEETLIIRQEELLRQIQEEKIKLLKQEDMIKARQQDRLKQVRAEKALLEKQEQMLKLREEQLFQERKRQEKLREEAFILKRQEEEIKKRQEEIAKELLKGNITLEATEVALGVQTKEYQVLQKRKPIKPEAFSDWSVLDVQPLNTSDWSSSDAESFISNHNTLHIRNPTYIEANENYDEDPFRPTKISKQMPEEDILSVSSEEEDTMEEDCYECKVEVKQQNTQIPTSVRTIETVIDVPGWAPITPYLNVSKNLTIHVPNDMSNMLTQNKSHHLEHKTSGIVTSPESLMNSMNMVTSPESSISLQSLMSNNEGELSSYNSSPVPPVPPLPNVSNNYLMDKFQTVHPEVPLREDSFNVTAVYNNDIMQTVNMEKNTQKINQQNYFTENNYNLLCIDVATDSQLSPKIGGPGSAFRPYASSENLMDPILYSWTRTNLVGSEKGNKRYTTSSSKTRILESDEDLFRPKPKNLKPTMISTTDTEPEMKEFNLMPIGNEKNGKKSQKKFYSTSETEEEYQAYLRIKPKWHGKGGHKDSWDPLQIASPPQIVQRPVGMVQKPLPQGKKNLFNGTEKEITNNVEIKDYSVLELPQRIERIQKSDSIIELRQKSFSEVEVVKSKSMSISPNITVQKIMHSNDDLNLSYNTILNTPQFLSLHNIEDQSTPKLLRKNDNTSLQDPNYTELQTENLSENLAPQIKSRKEDPEIKKKKEIHKNLMFEAIKKVESRNNQKKIFSQLSRTNPTIATLDIVTRKEIKSEELETRNEIERNKINLEFFKKMEKNELQIFQNNLISQNTSSNLMETKESAAITLRKQSKIVEQTENGMRQNNSETQKIEKSITEINRDEIKKESEYKKEEKKEKNQNNDENKYSISESKKSIKQTLPDIICVKPKILDPTSDRKTITEKNLIKQNVKNEQEFVTKSISLKTALAKSFKEEKDNPASVKRAAEKYEIENLLVESQNLSFKNRPLSNFVKLSVEEDTIKDNKGNFPWTSPQLAKKDYNKIRGYAVQMSKSSDNITSSKLLAGTRVDNCENQGFGNVKNLSKSIENQIDLYARTKEEIRLLLSLAKSGSVNDRIALFSNLSTNKSKNDSSKEKMENNLKDSLEAKACFAENISDTEIEFQDPIESKVKPLKIPMKPKILESNDQIITSYAMLNEIYKKDKNRFIVDQMNPTFNEMDSKLLKFNNKVQEKIETNKQRESPKKKNPKLLENYLLTSNNSLQIYTQSATDMSATEDEMENNKFKAIKNSISLKVPCKNAIESRPGLVKSKSFATSELFERTFKSDSKKVNNKPSSNIFSDFSEKCTKNTRRNSLSSFTPDFLFEEEDIFDVDAEFEDLLTRTFEKETKKKTNSNKCVINPIQSEVKDKRKKSITSKNIQKSQSCSVVDSAETKKDKNSPKTTEGSDSVFSISNLQNKQEKRSSMNKKSPERSPSPTQSEYDTADPWDEN